MTVKGEMQKMKHKNHRRGGRWRCALCLECDTGTTCAFDGESKLFKAVHYNCQTLLALRTAMRTVGKRTLRSEDREARGTTWHVALEDGRWVLCYWLRSIGRGFMDVAVEGPDIGPLKLETALGIIRMAQDELVGNTMGMGADELAELRERIGTSE